MIIHNRENERLRELDKPQGPQGDPSGGLIGNKKPIGVKWTKAAGQSQKMEKARLIEQIRALKARILISSGSGRNIAIQQLDAAQQMLANLLARYTF